MNRFADVDDGELRPQIRLLAIGAVISVVFLCGSLGVMLGGFTDPGIPKLPNFSPAHASVPGLPPGYPTGLPADLPTDIPTDIPTDLPTDFPSGLIPTDLPTLPGGNP